MRISEKTIVDSHGNANTCNIQSSDKDISLSRIYSTLIDAKFENFILTIAPHYSFYENMNNFVDSVDFVTEQNTVFPVYVSKNNSNYLTSEEIESNVIIVGEKKYPVSGFFSSSYFVQAIVLDATILNESDVSVFYVDIISENTCNEMQQLFIGQQYEIRDMNTSNNSSTNQYTFMGDDLEKRQIYLGISVIVTIITYMIVYINRLLFDYSVHYMLGVRPASYFFKILKHCVVDVVIVSVILLLWNIKLLFREHFLYYFLIYYVPWYVLFILIVYVYLILRSKNINVLSMIKRRE